LDVGAVVVVNRASQKLRLEEHQRLLEQLQLAVRSDITPGQRPGVSRP